MNKYQEALEKIGAVELYEMPKPDEDGFVYHSHVELRYYEDFETLKELVDGREKLKTIIKKYELELGNLKEYTQGHSLLNSLICDLNELVIDSTHNELDNIFANSLRTIERLKIKK